MALSHKESFPDAPSHHPHFEEKEREESGVNYLEAAETEQALDLLPS